ncbi:hypothetical protein FRC12_015938 [Ceratobasidium sp. 428]|nr:hypothetical protein FRC12_015938 [Ceratobasidium sp. 428]
MSLQVSTQWFNSEPFYFKDGNIKLVINGCTFHLHRHKLKEFLSFRSLIEANEPHEDGLYSSGLTSIALKENVEDVCNMLKVLYAPIYLEVETYFTASILKSALRLASKFSHLSMRRFAIMRLEKYGMDPIERILSARQSNIPLWREQGLQELCVRDAPITLVEAQLLGMETFVELAARREAWNSHLGVNLITFGQNPNDRCSAPSGGSETSYVNQLPVAGRLNYDTLDSAHGYYSGRLSCEVSETRDKDGALSQIIAAAFSTVSGQSNTLDG